MQLLTTPFFQKHNIIVAYSLAAWLAETDEYWAEMRDELKGVMDNAEKQ